VRIGEEKKEVIGLQTVKYNRSHFIWLKSQLKLKHPLKKTLKFND